MQVFEVSTNHRGGPQRGMGRGGYMQQNGVAPARMGTRACGHSSASGAG